MSWNRGKKETRKKWGKHICSQINKRIFFLNLSHISLSILVNTQPIRQTKHVCSQTTSLPQQSKNPGWEMRFICRSSNNSQTQSKYRGLCICQRASWTYPPQVFTSVHLFNKIVRSGFTINSPLFQNNWVKIHHRKNKTGWRFTKLICFF